MVEIPTTRTQEKIAEILHERDRCSHLDEIGQGLDNCWHRARYMAEASAMLAKLMASIVTEMFPQAHALLASSPETE